MCFEIGLCNRQQIYILDNHFSKKGSTIKFQFLREKINVWRKILFIKLALKTQATVLGFEQTELECHTIF